MLLQRLFILIQIVFIERQEPSSLWHCMDRRCTRGCITAALNETNYIKEGTPRDGYWSLRVENPSRETHVNVTKHHYCSFYGGDRNPIKKQPQKTAVLTGYGQVTLRHLRVCVKCYQLTNHGGIHMNNGFKGLQVWVWQNTMVPCLVLSQQTFLLKFYVFPVVLWCQCSFRRNIPQGLQCSGE